MQKEQTFQLGSLLSVSKCSMQNFYGGLLKGQWNSKPKEKSECTVMAGQITISFHNKLFIRPFLKY